MDEKEIVFSIKLDETHLNEIEYFYNLNVKVFITSQDKFILTIIVGIPEKYNI